MVFPGFNNKRRSSLGGDFDGDGVKNRKDCQPLNWKKQDTDPVLDNPVEVNDYNLYEMTTKNWNFFSAGRKITKKQAYEALDLGIKVTAKFKRTY